MASVNQQLYDAVVRHQHFLQRYGGSVANKIVKLLSDADADLTARLIKRLNRLGPVETQKAGQGLITTKRFQAILEEIRVQNAQLYFAIGKELTSELVDLAHLSVDIASRRLNEAIGIDMNNFRPSPEILRSAVTSQPFRGRILRELVDDLKGQRLRDITSQLRLGIIEGDTMPAIIKRIEQAGGISYGRAEGLARTAVNHVANRARDLTYQANGDIISAVRWTSVIDGRTTMICMSLDGQIFPVDSGPRPPAHYSCRSVVTPVTKTWDELAGNGAFEGRGASNIDRLFEKRLKERGFGPEQIATAKRDTRASMNGQIPGKLTYNDWLKTQPAGFQNQVLGPARAQLFRDGGLSLDKFVEKGTFRVFPLKELQKREAAAFAMAKPAF